MNYLYLGNWHFLLRCNYIKGLSLMAHPNGFKRIFSFPPPPKFVIRWVSCVSLRCTTTYKYVWFEESQTAPKKKSPDTEIVTSSHFMNFSPFMRLCGTSTGFKRVMWAGTLGTDIFHSSNLFRAAERWVFPSNETVRNRCIWLKGYHRQKIQNQTHFNAWHFTPRGAKKKQTIIQWKFKTTWFTDHYNHMKLFEKSIIENILF